MRPTPRLVLRFALCFHLMALAAGAESLPALDRNATPSPQAWGALPRTPRPDNHSGLSPQAGPLDVPSHDAEALADADAAWNLGRALTGRPGGAAPLHPRPTGAPSTRGSSGDSPQALDHIWRRLALGDQGTPLAELADRTEETSVDVLPPPNLLYKPDSRLFSTDSSPTPAEPEPSGQPGTASRDASNYTVEIVCVTALALGVLLPLALSKAPSAKRRKKRRRRLPRGRAEY